MWKVNVSSRNGTTTASLIQYPKACVFHVLYHASRAMLAARDSLLSRVDNRNQVEV